MDIILKILQVIIGIGEVSLGYQILFIVFLEKSFLNKRERAIIWSNIIILGLIMGVNRNLLFFSHILLLFSVFITTLCVWILRQNDLVLIVAMTATYYSLISLIDFFFAFLSIFFLHKDFIKNIFYSTSVWQLCIFMCSRTIMLICCFFLKRRKKVVDINEYTGVLLATGVAFGLVLRKYQVVLYEMVHGKRILVGRDAAVTLLSAILIIIFVGIILLRNIAIKKENQYLLLRDEMLEENHKNMTKLFENNQHVLHDMKHHLLVLGGMGKKGDLKSINEYLEIITKDIQNVDGKTWCGNQTLDLILNQKKIIAEQLGIKFFINTVRIVDLELNDSEICSLFCNLIDNAIEACEKKGSGEKWIEIRLDKQNQMFFINIANSISNKPNKRNGKFITDKFEKDLHGFGLKNVNRIVAKHDGVISFDINETTKIFQVCITFFTNISIKEKEGGV